MNFEQELINRRLEVERQMEFFLPEEAGLQKVIFEAVNYSVKAGGKRLRPILMSEAFSRTAKNKPDREAAAGLLSPFLAAIELIHTYSLVHDDLPAMDNDRYRRGKLTTHAFFGEAVGILAGDALLNLAYETAACAFDAAGRAPEESRLSLFCRAAKSLQILANRSGVYGMVGGQTVDVIQSGRASDLEELLAIYRLKTGALLETSLLCGAVLAGGTEEELNRWQELAGHLGVAFQIRDDILDVSGDKEVLGKPVHSDEKNQKTTYVTLCGLKAAQEEVKRRSELVVSIYDKYFGEPAEKENDFFRLLVLKLITREK